MESFLNRYRNITVLLLVIFAQLVLLAAQVKNAQDVRVIRVWAVSTVTPVARVAEFFRGGGAGFFHRYILLKDASEENRRLRDEVGRLRLENTFLRNELNTADRAKALQVFQAHTPSKMLAANVIMTGVGANANVVFVNRGSNDGVMRGMGVVTPDGIVGKVVASYPGGSQVMLVSDPEFSAGVISQKSQSRGILKGQGRDPLCKVDYVRFEDKVEVGEWFYTSGDDRVFPRGFPVGMVKSVKDAAPFKEVLVLPAGPQHGVEDVMIILESVHQTIPDTPPVSQPVYIAPPVGPQPGQTTETAPAANPAAPAAANGTEADKIRSLYQQSGDAQKHVFGTGLPGSKPPDFTKLGAAPNPPVGKGVPPAAGDGATEARPSGSAPNTTATPPKQAAPKQAAPPAAAPRQSIPAPPKTVTPPKTPPDAPAAATKQANRAAEPDAQPKKAPRSDDDTPKPFTIRANPAPGKTEPPPQKTPAAPSKGPGGAAAR